MYLLAVDCPISFAQECANRAAHMDSFFFDPQLGLHFTTKAAQLYGALWGINHLSGLFHYSQNGELRQLSGTVAAVENEEKALELSKRVTSLVDGAEIKTVRLVPRPIVHGSLQGWLMVEKAVCHILLGLWMEKVHDIASVHGGELDGKVALLFLDRVDVSRRNVELRTVDLVFFVNAHAHENLNTIVDIV